MASAKIFRINYKSDFILTLESDAGWMTPFCIKFWTGAPSQAYYVGWDGETYTHCSFDPSEPTKLLVQFDDHHLPIGDLKFQVAYHFTVADFPNDTEDEVINPANITTEIDGETYQVMLDFTGETAPEIQFALPAYANEAQRIANEQQRIAAETQRIANEETRIANEQTRINQEQTRQQNEQQRINQEQARVNEYATLKADAVAATDAANDAATLAQQKAEYAQQQGGYAKDQGDYAKNQGDYAKEQGDTALADHQRAEADHGIAVDDHTQAGNDHTRAESDHGIAVDDHTQAGNDHTRAEADHGIAVDDHTQAGNDHTRAESDHGIAVDDHTQAGNDHTRAESDHGIAADDHTQAGNDHTQAGNDHTRAESDHGIAAADHTQASNDHTRAESDHTRAESDHAVVEVYVDSLGAFDISAYHATGGVLAKYADLTAALGTNGANIPEGIRKGGMSVKYVQTSDNKYIQARCMAQNFTTDVTQWAIAEEGVYVENPEFVYVKTDAEGKILWAIRTDGDIFYGAGVPSQVVNYINEKIAELSLDEYEDIVAFLNNLEKGDKTLQNLLNEKVDKEEGKSLINAEFAEGVSQIENPEYIEAKTDSEGKLLAGRTPDGAAFENVGFSTPKVSIDGHTIENTKDVEERIEIKTDSEHRIISYRDKDGVLHEEAGIVINHLGLSFDATQELINALNALGYTANNPADWSDSEFVEIPIPSVCAIVNIETGSQAEAKGVDIPTHIQFWDRAGNYFRKPIVLNAQGSSSMSYHIKNQAIDFTDGSEIKFGNWVPCDSFHIKKYFIDVFRGQCIVGYWLTEQVYQTRPYGERRPWDYLNSFNDVNNSNGSFSKDYATGALAHPDGFPVKVFFNGKNSGIYAFNLKKDRSNYYCKKDKQKQIILDGILGSTFWMANGDLTQPGEDGGNIWHDFEVRNPKISKDINGDKYDGDNPKEPSDDYATTKAAIERLTTAITLVNAESTTEAKKTKFEEFFIVPFLIDYDLIGQVIYNNDGYRKNWIWITNDGNKWCPTSYDMDSIFGQHWNGASYLSESITTILGTNNDIPTGTNLLKELYQTEMRGRYKELRDSGIFSVDNIVGLLEKWVNACGYDNLKEDIEEVVTSPYMEEGVIVVDGEGKQVLIPNTPSYRDGTKEYAYPPTSGGWYNSILRVKNWLTQRIQTLDTYYNYTNN